MDALQKAPKHIMDSTKKIVADLTDKNGNPYSIAGSVLEKFIASQLDEYGHVANTKNIVFIDNKNRRTTSPVSDKLEIANLVLYKDSTRGINQVEVEYNPEDPETKRFVDWHRFSNVVYTKNQDDFPIDAEKDEDISSVIMTEWQKMIHDFIVSDSVADVLADFYDEIRLNQSEYRDSAWLTMFSAATNSMISMEKRNEIMAREIEEIRRDSVEKGNSLDQMTDNIVSFFRHCARIRKEDAHRAFNIYSSKLAESAATGNQLNSDDVRMMAEETARFADSGLVKKSFAELYFYATSPSRRQRLGELWDRFSSGDMDIRHVHNKDFYFLYKDFASEGKNDASREKFINALDSYFSQNIHLERGIDQAIVRKAAKKISDRKMAKLETIVSSCEQMSMPSFRRLYNYVWALFRDDNLNPYFVKPYSFDEVKRVKHVLSRLEEIGKSHSLGVMKDVADNYRKSGKILEQFVEKYEPLFKIDCSEPFYLTEQPHVYRNKRSFWRAMKKPAYISMVAALWALMVYYGYTSIKKTFFDKPNAPVVQMQSYDSGAAQYSGSQQQNQSQTGLIRATENMAENLNDFIAKKMRDYKLKK